MKFPGYDFFCKHVAKYIFSTLVILCCTSAYAREYRSIGFAERVSSSDIIAVVLVESIGNKYQVGEGIAQYYSVVRSEDLIKGSSARGGTFKFITEGLTPEYNPECCEVGKEYLIFGRFGYPELDLNEAMDANFVLKDVDLIVSPADGRFSALEVTDGSVEVLRKGRVERVPLAHMISRIKRAMRSD